MDHVGHTHGQIDFPIRFRELFGSYDWLFQLPLPPAAEFRESNSLEPLLSPSFPFVDLASGRIFCSGHLHPDNSCLALFGVAVDLGLELGAFSKRQSMHEQKQCEDNDATLDAALCSMTATLHEHRPLKPQKASPSPSAGSLS
jgi:hypothetical protein